MFRATLCPSSGADDFEVFIRCVAAVTMGSFIFIYVILDIYENNTTHCYSCNTSDKYVEVVSS